MNDRNGNTVVSFEPGWKGNVGDEGNPVDGAGKAIIALLKEAAATAKATCLQAVDAAQKASHQLRTAEDRIKELELEIRQQADRADRAEKWLAFIHQEMEEKFFGPIIAAQSYKP